MSANLISALKIPGIMGLFLEAMVLAICFIIGYATYRFSLLTIDGAIAAGIIGVIIGLLRPAWIVLLFSFLIAGVAVTKYRFSDKKERGVQEGRRGERGYRNVLSTGAVPAIIAVLSVTVIPERLSGVIFLVSIATAASDTLASEMGVLSEKTVLITNFERVVPGTNGGISLYGTLWAIIGAFVASVFGGIFLLTFSNTYAGGLFYLLVPGMFGFLGCITDSFLGATLENRGLIGKGTVNFVSALLASGLAYVVGIAGGLF